MREQKKKKVPYIVPGWGLPTEQSVRESHLGQLIFSPRVVQGVVDLFLVLCLAIYRVVTCILVTSSHSSFCIVSGCQACDVVLRNN